jgi:hypothetical protein
MNRIGLTGLGLLIAMAFSTSSVVADGSLLTPAMLGQDGGGMSGWLEAGWAYNFDDSVTASGRTHDRGHNDVGVAQIGVDYDNGAGGDSAVGYHVTFVYGANGLGGNGNGDDFNLTNANVQWVLPAGVPGLTGAKLTLGRFESPVGGESIYGNGNDHVTRGTVSSATDPIAHTGVIVEKALVSGADGDVVNARLGILNSTGSGWDSAAGDGTSYLVGVDYAGLAGIDLGLNVLHQASENDSTLFDASVSMDVPGALADVVSLLGDTTLAAHLVFGDSPSTSEDTFGFSTGARYDFGLPLLGDDGSTKNWYLAVRYDNYDESGDSKDWSLTSTLGYQAADNLLMRIEYRWDRGVGDDEDSQTGLNVNLVTSF